MSGLLLGPGALVRAVTNLYDPTATYTKDQHCTQDGLVYKAKQNISTPEAWNSSHWELVKLTDDIESNSQAIQKIEEGIAYRLGDTNTTGATLAVGTYVYVEGNTNGVANGMYKVSTAIVANGSLTTSNLTAVSGGIGNELNSKLTPLDGKFLAHEVTIGSSLNTTYTYAYPTGFNASNSVIIGYTAAAANHYWYTNNPAIEVGGNTRDGITVKITDIDFANQKLEIMFAKM